MELDTGFRPRGSQDVAARYDLDKSWHRKTGYWLALTEALGSLTEVEPDHGYDSAAL